MHQDLMDFNNMTHRLVIKQVNSPSVSAGLSESFEVDG